MKDKIYRGTTWIAIGRIIVNLLNFISTIVLARILVPADFGLVAVGTTLLLIVGGFTNLSLSSALIRHSDPQPYHFHTAWTLGTLRGIAIALIFIAISYPVASFYNDTRIPGIMAVMSLTFLFYGMANPKVVMLMRDLVFWQQFLIQVSERVVTTCVTIGFAYYYKSYWAIVLGPVCGQFVSLLISYTFLPFLPRPNLKGTKDLLSFSMWLTAGQIINTVNWKVDQLIVGRLLGKEALGHYTVGDSIAVIPTREISSPLTATLFPSFFNISHDMARLRAAYSSAQAVLVAVALPCGIGLALIAKPFVLLTMGDKWEAAIFIIQALSAVYALQTVGSLVQPLALATNQPRLLFYREVQGFIIRIPLLLIGCIYGGLPGIIIARLITGAIGILINTMVVKTILKLPILTQLAGSWRTYLSICAMVLASLVMDRFVLPSDMDAHRLMHIVITIAVAAPVYVVTHFVFWLLAGKPRGPESEVVRLLTMVRSKLTRVAVS